MNLNEAIQSQFGGYRLRIGLNPDDTRAAQALRFLIFNLELHEGLQQSYTTGLDADPFDTICDHLLVEEIKTGVTVGTYRLQPGLRAAKNLGYYSEQEFDFSPYEPVRSQLVELGRACVHKDHRNLAVLHLLWKGIARYATAHDSRYLIGCSSLTSQDPAAGLSAFMELENYLAEPEWRTQPLPAYRLTAETPSNPPPKIPKLLFAYLNLGARICGPPAMDREFGTIDFLTLFDLRALAPKMLARFLG